MVAIALAFVLLLVVVGIYYFGLLALAFGADSCSEVGNDASVSLLMAAPAVMALGIVVAAICSGSTNAGHGGPARWPPGKIMTFQI